MDLPPKRQLLIHRTHSDNPESFAGAPVGLQLVGRTQEDEAVIAMTEIVDKALKNIELRRRN